MSRVTIMGTRSPCFLYSRIEKVAPSRPLRMALLCLLMVGHLPVAAAGEQPDEGSDGISLAVLELDAPRHLGNLGRGLASVVAQEARLLGHVAVGAREARARVGTEGIRAASACGYDGACLARVLGALGADVVVVGSLDRGRKAYRVRLVCFDLSDGRVVGGVSRTVMIASRRLERDVREAVPSLLAGHVEATGLLRVVTGVAGARVLVNERHAGETPPTVEVALSPGRHHIRVVARDHLPFERFVEVAAGETTLVEARLFLEPSKRRRAFPDEGPREVGTTREP